MTNKEIAKAFNELANLMELHDENPFKIKSYQLAYASLRKIEKPFSEMSKEELDAIKGVGKAISEKIIELVQTGEMQALNKYRNLTPPGVREMLQIKGLGAKKVQTIWKDLEAESVGELWYACNENRLVELKGFGAKTQEEIRKLLDYYLRTKDFLLYAAAEAEAQAVISLLAEQNTGARIEITGSLRRNNPVISQLEVLVGTEDGTLKIPFAGIEVKEIKGNIYECSTGEGTHLTIYTCKTEEFGSKQFLYTGPSEFVQYFIEKRKDVSFKNLAWEPEVFEKANYPYIAPELRDVPEWLEKGMPELIAVEDIRGVVHSHTTYSDGVHTLAEMASEARKLGYGYILITDHSKSAFYANGLKEDRLRQQWDEIEALNRAMAPFRILKGIESDILNDGSLDYSDEVLAEFDCVIASVHSNLKMSAEKANARLIGAIENQYTRILGHPTGRLLLSREGYPIDHRKIIDACAANGVAIELNANPWRLDLDWSWIQYAVEKGVLISINPDAHSREGISDIRYGVLVARKGGLTAAQCLNHLDVDGFLKFCKKILH